MRVRRASGLPVYDLTSANPTQCGIHYKDGLLNALQAPSALEYEPDPRGLLAARLAVCGYYSDHLAEPQMEVHPDQIVLTTSTSEAYSFLFRLLADPEDEVLIAQPSYPLFDFLAVLDDVKLTSYPLFYDHGWHFDLAELRRRISRRTRAIVVVHPNNPTGSYTTENDRRALEAICIEHGLALIVDEVFLDYSFNGRQESFAAGPHPALTFVMSGLSKVAGLPQMKLSWIAVFGPESIKQEALGRLEIVSDTFLSVCAPLQHALPHWLAGRGAIQKQIQERVSHNLAALDRQLEHAATVDRLRIEGGWYAILRVPAIHDGEELASILLREQGVAVHPGSFFVLPESRYLVLSLLVRPDTFSEGIARLLQLVDASSR